MLDAILGEVIVTCEKIHWLCNEGERWLKPEKRSPGILSFYKSARVEYHPVGVVGCCVPPLSHSCWSDIFISGKLASSASTCCTIWELCACLHSKRALDCGHGGVVLPFLKLRRVACSLRIRTWAALFPAC